MDPSAARALARVSIFAVGIGPYLSASFIVLLATAFSKRVRAILRSESAARCARGLTIIFALIEGYALARALELGNSSVLPLIMSPGLIFRATTAITIATGTVFLIWLAEQITKHGIGNGISLMLFSPLVVSMPRSFYRLFEDKSAAFLSADAVRGALIAFAGLVVLIVLIESAELRIPVRYSHVPQGDTSLDAMSWLRFKINNAGIVPIYFAVELLLLPATIKNVYNLQDGVIAQLAVALVVILSFVYVALVLSPTKMAADLERYGGGVPPFASGQPTADYLDRLLTWATLIGALYLWAVSMLPSYFALLYLPVTVSGISLLVVVAVALDTVQQGRALWPAGAPARPVEDGITDGAPSAD